MPMISLYCQIYPLIWLISTPCGFLGTRLRLAAYGFIILVLMNLPIGKSLLFL